MSYLEAATLLLTVLTGEKSLSRANTAKHEKEQFFFNLVKQGQVFTCFDGTESTYVSVFEGFPLF